MLIFFISKAKFKDFKNGIQIANNPEIKITRNGILFNKAYLISYNNQDNFLAETKLHSFYDKTCLQINVESYSNSEVGGKIINSYYVLIPKKVESKIDFYIKLMNDNKTFK